VSQPPAPVRPERHRRDLTALPLVLVVVGLVVGLATVRAHHFRIGCEVAAASICLAAAFRLLLPARRAGLLVVRGRAFDVACLAVMGLAVGVLALLVPPG
jgi:hypothetical protein